MNKNSLSTIGLVLLGIGVYMILAEYNLIFKISFSWPVALILIGAAMLLAFFNTKPKKNYLIWGNLLIFAGIGFTFIENVARFNKHDDESYLLLLAFAGLAVLVSGIISKKHRYLVSYGVPMLIGGIFLNIYYLSKELNLRLWDDDLPVLAAILILAGLKFVLDTWFGKTPELEEKTDDKA